MQKLRPLRSKATQAGIHLALSMEDIRNEDGTPSPETNGWHRSEAERLARECRDDMEAREIRDTLAIMRREEREDRRIAFWAKVIRFFKRERDDWA